jgi:hypothetical protein
MGRRRWGIAIHWGVSIFGAGVLLPVLMRVVVDVDAARAVLPFAGLLVLIGGALWCTGQQV